MLELSSSDRNKKNLYIYSYIYQEFFKLTSQINGEKKKGHFGKGRNDQTNVSPMCYCFKNSLNSLDERNKEIHQNKYQEKKMKKYVMYRPQDLEQES